jgi:histone H3/H4
MVKQVVLEEKRGELRFARKAVNTLHDLLEAKTVARFQASQDLAGHRGIKSVREPDFKLAGYYQRVY